MLTDSLFYYLLLTGFTVGLMDVMVDGGGLLQIPGLFNLLSNATPAASVMGINKFVSCCDTLTTTGQYLRRISVLWKMPLPAAVLALVASYLGANVVAYFPVQYIKSAMLVITITMYLYTSLKKDLGQAVRIEKLAHRETWWGLFFDALIGFYDDTSGPGTSNLLAFILVRFYGYDLLTTNAAGKVINSTTSLAVLTFFVPQGHVIWTWMAPLALANLYGGVVDARSAIRGGTRLLRYGFMLLLCLTIGKFAWDLLS